MTHAVRHGTSWHCDWASPWFIGLFAMGMAAALLQASPNLSIRAIAIKRLMTGPLAAALLLLGCWALPPSRVAMDFLFGAATICAILYCGRPSPGSPPLGQRLLLGLLHTRPLQLLG